MGPCKHGGRGTGDGVDLMVDPTVDLTIARASAALQTAGLTDAVTRVQPLDGGVSNLTWLIERGASPPVVLRVQRRQGIFEPYDVIREARVLQALAGTAIPVPRVLAREPGAGQLGAPFFVMEYVDARHMGEARRSAGTSDAYVRSVAAIHRLNWRAAGLEFLDPPPPGPDAAGRDLDAVMQRAANHGLSANPFITETARWLRARLPRTAAPALCQGDINIYNYLVRAGEIVAVVDWEQAQIGDPLSDLGLLAALHYARGATGAPAALPLIARYAQVSGRELSALPYFTLAGLHKLAVIHGIWSALLPEPPWYTWEDVVESAAGLRAAMEGGPGGR